MKCLVFGKNGQIGWELQRTLAPLGEITALGYDKLDLTDIYKVRQMVREVKPHLIVNAAAYTAVDKAEEEQELAMTVNGIVPGVLAEEAKHLNAGLIHYSTDYIFDGKKGIPYTEDDQPKPLNVYGKTKLAGERAIQDVGGGYLILRTSWVYGLRGKNFLLTVLRLARERKELSIVDDQIGSPTWSRIIAEATANIVAKGNSNIHQFLSERKGIYHLSSSGSTSWHGFAQSILSLDPYPDAQICKLLKAVETCEYPTPAKRPNYSVLANNKLRAQFGLCLPEWESLLQIVFNDYKG